MDIMKPAVLIKKGAEASIYVREWHDRRVVLKKRLPKKYRPPKLDTQIRSYRTIHEPQLMHEAKKAGVSTPTIFLVNVKEATIIMEFVEGKQVKRLLNEVSSSKGKQLSIEIGQLIGRLHKYGVIHGDLTTSNMILTPEERLVFVDFGLGERTMETESRGVDMHLMKRALESAHFQIAKKSFESVVTGYSEVLGEEKTQDVLDKIIEIERRGRYVAERRKE